MVLPSIKEELFNIDLIINFDTKNTLLRPITSTQIFEPSSTIFKKDGLFSLDIFGPMGSDVRNRTLAYVNLNIPVLHPLIYSTLITLRRVYDEILSGKTYAVFNTEKGDFDIVKDASEGSTGYEFFLSNLEKIKWDDRGSDARKFNIDLIKKYGNKKSLLDKWLILPAGMRDYTVNEEGRPSEHEINAIYRKLMNATDSISNIKVTDTNLLMFDKLRYKIQKTLFEIYDFIFVMLDGKKKFIQGKWAKRGVMYGTRNVITPSTNNVTDLNTKNPITVNHTVIGLYQYVKAIFPVVVNKVKNRFLTSVFNPDSELVWLVDPKTMKFRYVNINIKTRDSILSADGINDLSNKLGLDDTIATPVKIDGYYLLLIYDTGDSITLIKNNEEILEGMDVSKIRPITYGELFYLSVFDIVDKYPGYLTRYPVIGLGSIYPSLTYLKTTTIGREVKFVFRGEEITLPEYPKFGENWWRSLSPHISKLARAQGDFDGDCVLGQIFIRISSLSKKLKNKSSTVFISNDKKIEEEDDKMSLVRDQLVYKYGLVDLKDFPKGKKIKEKGNTTHYEVPNNMEVLTVWNGEYKWVKPESYSVHTGLELLSVKTHSGNTIECSKDNSIITADENLNYKRVNPVRGMTIPRIRHGLTKLVDPNNFKRTIVSEGITFNLNKDLGYVFGAIIGDGWIDKLKNGINHNKSKIMLASVEFSIRDKITEVLISYGHSGNCYTIESPHEFEGHKCLSYKHSWSFLPLRELFDKTIGKGAYNKQLPDWWLKTTPGFRWGLLSGLIDTDGSARVDDKNRLYVKYDTVSQRLAYDFRSLCGSLGLNTSLTATKRPNRNFVEYTIFISTVQNDLLQRKLILQHSKKKEALQSFKFSINRNTYTYTPNLPLNRLLELRSKIKGGSEGQSWKDVTVAIRKCEEYKNDFGYFNREAALRVIKSNPEIFYNDGYWSKFKKIVEDENIEWEVITSVVDLPLITEAYDLTVPPFNTFVIQNGVIVYDTCSYNMILTEEAINEINKKFKDISFYLNPDNSITASMSTDVSDEALLSLMR